MPSPGQFAEQLLGKVGRLPVVDRHPVPGRGEGESGGSADTTGSSCDQHRPRAGHRPAMPQFPAEAVTQEVYFGPAIAGFESAGP